MHNPRQGTGLRGAGSAGGIQYQTVGVGESDKDKRPLMDWPFPGKEYSGRVVMSALSDSRAVPDNSSWMLVELSKVILLPNLSRSMDVGSGAKFLSEDF